MLIGCRIVQRKIFLKERIFIWMDSIQQLFAIDLKAFGLTIFIVLLGLQTCIKLMQWFLFDLLGIETKAMREKKQEHELLLTTADELKKLSEELQQTMFAISQKAYEAVQKESGAANSEANSAGSENASSDKKDDDVIDAEFTKE